MCGTAARAARVSRSVQPVHQRMSVSVAGPKAASQQRSSSTCAAATSSSSIGPPSQSSVVTQRNCGLIHDPRGRPRTRRPSIAICGSTRAPALCSTTHLPEPKRSFFASSGTSAVTSVVIASPRAATAATAALPARVIQEPGRVETPLSRTKPSSRFRCVAATARVAPAKTDRDELARDGPERPPHREQPDEAPVLVERSLDVGRARRRRCAPGSRGRR